MQNFLKNFVAFRNFHKKLLEISKNFPQFSEIAKIFSEFSKFFEKISTIFSIFWRFQFKFTEISEKNPSSFLAPTPHPHRLPHHFFSFSYFSIYFCYFHKTFEWTLKFFCEFSQYSKKFSRFLELLKKNFRKIFHNFANFPKKICFGVAVSTPPWGKQHGAFFFVVPTVGLIYIIYL